MFHGRVCSVGADGRADWLERARILDGLVKESQMDMNVRWTCAQCRGGWAGRLAGARPKISLSTGIAQFHLSGGRESA